MKLTLSIFWAFVLLALDINGAELPEANHANSFGTLSNVEKIERLVDTHEYDRAIEFAVQEIQKIEASLGRYDISLVNPLIFLGDSQLALGLPEPAMDSWDRARQVQRQSVGLFTLDQVKVLYREADVLYRQEQHADANEKQELAYSIHVHNHGLDSGEVLPGLIHLAQWYLGTYNVYAARGLFLHAIDLIKENEPVDENQLIFALRQLARSYVMEKFQPSVLGPEAREIHARPYGSINNEEHYHPDINNYAPGEVALIDVVNLYREREDVSKDVLAEAMIELADWYQMFEKYARASVIYDTVWHMYDDEPANDIRLRLSKPEELYQPWPIEEVDTWGDTSSIATGRVKFTFTLSGEGKPYNVQVIDKSPPDLAVNPYAKAVKESLYRPRIAAGRLVRQDNIEVIHEFKYETLSSDSVNRDSI